MKLDFSGLKILVIGDPMADVYHWGRVERLSPEGPWPIFLEDDREVRWGGAMNVWVQLEALGCDAHHAWDIPTAGYGWTQKNRYMVGNHCLFRVDDDQCVENQIPALDGFSAIVISDYAKGACTPEICQEAIVGAMERSIPVIVDPKGPDWSKYQGVTVICPNEKEYQEQYRTSFDDTFIVLKRAAAGIDLIKPYESERVNYPAQVHRVSDVTGAGDTVTAVIAACAGSNIGIAEACKLANLAAGCVVSEVGTTVCRIEKLRDLCKDLA